MPLRGPGGKEVRGADVTRR